MKVKRTVITTNSTQQFKIGRPIVLIIGFYNSSTQYLSINRLNHLNNATTVNTVIGFQDV
jgi:hypothetical protein